MVYSSVNRASFKLSPIVILILLLSILYPSYQDVRPKVLGKEFEKKSSTNCSRRIRQKYYNASGVRQSLGCGLNSLSVTRRPKRRSDGRELQGSVEWPWMAAFLLKNGYFQFCGGTLLNRRYVLTAAHCFAEPGTEKSLVDIIVRLGEYDLYTPNETNHQDFAVEKIEIHKLYDPADERNDIALVKLARRVLYNQYIRPLCLPSLIVQPNQTTIVAGWGTKSVEDEEHSNVLLDVNVPIVGYDKCSDLIGVSNAVDKKKNICAGGMTGKDSCKGDSGGPLVIQETSKEKRWMIVGIVSFGLGCGVEYSPGVYTNVRNYLDWIGKRILDAAP